MKKIKFIKNKSLSTVTINGFDMLSNIKIEISRYSSYFKTEQGYNDIMKYHLLNTLEFYDMNNILMTDDEFINFYNYFKNKFLSLPEYYRIYEFITDDCSSRYNDYSLTPKSVDYIQNIEIRFPRKETFTRGFLTNVEYFESSTTGANNIITYINPILNVNIKYYINSIGYVTHRESIRKWVKNDGTYSSDVKISYKKYNGILSREEAIQRRNNIINQVVIDIVNITYSYYYLTKTYDEVELMILPLMDSLENEINKYIKGNLQPFIVGIMSANNITHPWLDIIVEGSTTLQDYIENKLLEAILSEGVYTSTEPS